jgi:hypothetical protein
MPLSCTGPSEGIVHIWGVPRCKQTRGSCYRDHCILVAGLREARQGAECLIQFLGFILLKG